MSTPHNRTLGRGCPVCSNKAILKGYNDLATNDPNLAKEWHPTKNENLKPEEVSKMSNRRVWWLCKQGHEWEAIISNRSRGKKCPYCSNRKILKGHNDLGTLRPDIAKDWDYDKNKLSPEEVSSYSNLKVFWKCSNCKYEYIRQIQSKNKNNKCPNCKV